MTQRTALFINTDTRAPVAAMPAAHPASVHRGLPGYATTPLTDCPVIADELGLAQILVKDESSRLELPSFKILGASYAIYRELARRLGTEADRWNGIDDVRAAVSALRPLALAAATDGNHGRAVARMAKLLGLPARIYVPTGTSQARIAAIEGEGAAVEVVDGDYDDAIAVSAAAEGEHCAVISDTSWPGYERVPGWVIDGYSTIFTEVRDALTRRGEADPDVIAVPIGVGALAAAAVRAYRDRDGRGRVPRILGVEPADAACVLASLSAGERVSVPGPHRSIMAGLNCGTPSVIAWPDLRNGLDAVVAIDDERSRDGMRSLAGCDIVSGETGAAALGGLSEVLLGPDPRLREKWGLGASTRALVLSTEGATDPGSYADIVGRESVEVGNRSTTEGASR